jgi:hypothetical protein
MKLLISAESLATCTDFGWDEAVKQGGIFPQKRYTSLGNARMLAAVEIPMVGTGASLNVAVAGSLVLYRLAGFL